MTEPVKIEQRHREAADNWKRNWEHCQGSHTALVQAFANFERDHMATPAPTDQLVEALEGICHFRDAVAYRTDPLAVSLRQWIDAGEHALAAYEALAAHKAQGDEG